MTQIGVGLWSLRSTAALPGSPTAAYANLLRDAALAEAAGFHSVWLSEHHFCYDGWCPAPLVAIAAVLARTTRLRAGTAVHLGPLQTLDGEAATLDTLGSLSAGRLELGIGLGYRPEEYAGFDRPLAQRGRDMDALLDGLRERWAAPGAPAPPRIWVGGFSDAAVRRAARRGLGLVLPSSLRANELARVIGTLRAHAREADRAPGPVAVMKHAWLTDGSESADAAARAMVVEAIREYSGSYFPLGGQVGFAAPERLERQMQRARETSLIGTAGRLIEGLGELASAGADLIVLHLTSDERRVEHRANMALIAEHVLPAFAS